MEYNQAKLKPGGRTPPVLVVFIKGNNLLI